MLTRTSRLTATILAPAIVATLAAWGCGGSSPTAPSTPTVTPATLPEMVMGSATASITMLEYSSLDCPHCADFHTTTLPAIKSAYIDPGQVKVVFREFPL